jgi:hypothetical protein
MLLGGVSVEDRLVRDLASLVDKSLGRKLETALLFRAQIVGLTREERRAVLAALESAPDDLKGLREQLRADEAWRFPGRP